MGENPLQIGGPIWARYAEGTAGRDPMPFVFVALDRATATHRGRLAIDLGCGAGNETLAFLDAGWHVHAVDGEAKAIEILEGRVPAGQEDRLSTQHALFHDADLPEADLVFASLSLPFAVDKFEDSIQNALDAVAPGGWFVGVLFGPNDSWAEDDDTAVHERSYVEGLFSEWTNLDIDEQEFEGPSAGGPKHWHWYVISAQKP